MSTPAPSTAVGPTAEPADDGAPVLAILDRIAEGTLLLDADDRVLPPQTRAAAELLRRTKLVGAHFVELLKPLASERSLARVGAALASWRETGGTGEPVVLDEVELRLPRRDGTIDSAYYRIEFHRVAAAENSTPAAAADAGRCLVVVADATTLAQQARELADLRRELQTQTEILRGVLRLGRARFAASVQKTGAAMTAIEAVLKKPAREQAAFRRKLEETLDHVDRIRREGVALKLTSLESAARSFEDALHELRGRSGLSGSDFLPLAMKLDDLYGEFATLRAAAKNALPTSRAAETAALTDNGTQIIDAPQFIRKLREAAAQTGAPRPAPAGSLESTLVTLTEHIAEEHGKKAALECTGLETVPAAYQASIKNVAIQLIRNAIMHGVESAPRRARGGKPALAILKLGVKRLPDGGYEMRFHDDGRGIDPALVRKTAVAKGLVSADEAAALADRQAIKLIFRAGFTTLPPEAGGPAHGAGLTLVRRYVDEAGGAIALASEPGKNTRYKISFPPLA